MSRFNDLPEYKKFDGHLWADYIELLCAWNPDREISTADYIDWIRLKETDIKIDNKTVDFNNDGVGLNDPELIDDKFSSETSDLFQYFISREQLYQDSYPFRLEGKVLKLKDYPCSNENHLLYFYLLCCSHLSYFSDHLSEFTSEFELLCELTTKALIPDNSTLHNVGKNTLGEPSAYMGNLFKKLSQIAQNLGETLKVEENSFSKTNSGDGGLDLIGWVNFSDNLNSRIVFVGQSKCNQNWFDAKSAGIRLRSYVNLINNPNDLYFIPFCYRAVNNNWITSSNVDGLTLIDRSRILLSLGPKVKEFIAKSKSVSTVISLLKEPESVY